MSASLKGQTALVTGAGGGIGRAVTLGLAAAGATLCLVGRTASTLEVVAEAARASRVDAVVCPADLAAPAAVGALTERVSATVGPVDILVHAAGVLVLDSAEGTPSGALDQQYRINVRAPYLLTRELLGGLRRRHGQIVFVNSSAGVTARRTLSQYAASKHALRALADSLREEVNPDGIRVLSVFLGRTATRMQEAVHRAEGRPYRPERLLQPEDVASVIVHALGLPRTAEVTDIHMRPLLNWAAS